MKKILFISAILLTAFCYKSESQVNVNINIGAQPGWGPVGYDYVDYYYLPDMGVYYDVPRHLFVYFDFGRWNFAAALPGRYDDYDLDDCYKVVINERDPWLRDGYYRDHYRRYRGRHQYIIRDSRDDRYIYAREHDDNGWHRGRREGGHYDNGKGKWHYDNGRGHGRKGGGDQDEQ